MAASMVRHATRTLRNLRRSALVYSRSQYFVSDNKKDAVTTNTEKTDSQGSDKSSAQSNIERTSALFRFTEGLHNLPNTEGNLDDMKDDDDFECDDLIPDEQFTTLVRSCKLMQIGEASHRVVLGEIIEVVGDDLYIDFGGKFHCVCPRPKFKPERYQRGARVKVSLKDFEMSSAFLGSVKHLTLLEADGSLIGLHRTSMT